MASGVTTLGGQAFGAGQHQLVGIITQRAILISLIMTTLIVIGWTQLRPVMAALGERTVLGAMGRIIGR